MRSLLIQDQPGTAVRDLVQQIAGGTLFEVASLQGAIERLEAKKENYDLIVCDYNGGSLALLKCLVQVSTSCPCIVLIDNPAILPELFLVPREAILETAARKELPTSLEAILQKLKEDGLFSESDTSDDDFVRIETKTLALNYPLEAEIFIRLAPNRYCRRFRKEDRFDHSDLKTITDRGIEAVFLRKTALNALFENQVQTLDALIHSSSLDETVARRASIAKLEMIHDVVNQLGFSPQIQELTKKSVSLTLKAIGNSPRLSSILSRLQRHEGKYIASHSVMLAEIACAIAHRVGWGTSQMFLKLSLAAFMHDISLTDNTLAQFRTLEELESEEVPEQELQRFKLHPIKAAEYAREFDGIPPDVDTILLQHHELPDGTGFPRKLHHHQIHPVAAVFIMAHDLLHFFLEHVPTNTRTDMVANFLEQNLTKYADGNFARIRESLETGEAIPLTVM